MEAKLSDITCYLKDFIGGKKDGKPDKKGMHDKIREVIKLDKTHLHNLEEIKQWFEAFKSWKSSRSSTHLEAVRESLTIESRVEDVV